jgi:GAF domain-containing protein
MNPLRLSKALLFLLIAALILTACQPEPSTEEEIDVIVALTQTAAAQATEAAEIPQLEATKPPEPTFVGDLRPLAPEECEQLAGFMVNRLVGPPIEQVEVAVQREGETGSGCQAVGSGTGEVFPDMFVLVEAMDGILSELGWTEDPSAPACLGAGGTGPGANNYCYIQADAFCELFVHTDPIDEALCSDDEPIFVCFERLAPEQIIYTVEVTCARDLSPEAKPLDSDLMRIEFEPGAIRAAIKGEVAAGGSDHYVLAAMEGQVMTVNLLDRSDEIIPFDTAVLVIWGDEGTVLASSHVEALSWEGTLPFTQDYFINVSSRTDQPIPYTLEVIIPPAPTS